MRKDQFNNQFAEVIDQIVNTVHPKRIILFGSTARRERKAHSDYDLLVVMPNGVNCSKLMGELYVHTMHSGFPFDFIVTTEDKLDQYKDIQGLIYHQAIKEGVELYAA